MKEKLTTGEIHGLSREYFYFLVEETFLGRGLACPSAQQIDRAIQQTSGLMKQVVEASFRLIHPAKVATELGLGVLKTRQLYGEALSKVVSILEG